VSALYADLVEPQARRYMKTGHYRAWEVHSKVLNDAAHFIVVADKEKFQGSCVVPKQQAHLQPGAALENIFPQPPDGNATVSVRMAETIGNCLKRRFNAREIRLAQTFERGLKARGQDNGGFSHV
jgi:hypothetical protein